MERVREERLQIMITMEGLRAVDDFRYTSRMPSRAAAIRELLNRGLRSLDSGVVAANSRSRDFGVLEIANGSNFEQENTTTTRKCDGNKNKRVQN